MFTSKTNTAKSHTLVLLHPHRTTDLHRHRALHVHMSCRARVSTPYRVSAANHFVGEPVQGAASRKLPDLNSSKRKSKVTNSKRQSAVGIRRRHVCRCPVPLPPVRFLKNGLVAHASPQTFPVTPFPPSPLTIYCHSGRSAYNAYKRNASIKIASTWRGRSGGGGGVRGEHRMTTRSSTRAP